MLSIRWYGPDRALHVAVAGDRDGAVALAVLMEGAGIPFKVMTLHGVGLGQADLGCGDFRHWLAPSAPFPEPA